jgi:hypothetical protein
MTVLLPLAFGYGNDSFDQPGHGLQHSSSALSAVAWGVGLVMCLALLALWYGRWRRSP